MCCFAICVSQVFYLNEFYGSSIPRVPIPRPPPPSPPGICHFVWEKLQMLHSGDRHSYKNPMVRLKNRVQMPHPRTTLKLYFPVERLQMPHFKNVLEISNTKHMKHPTQIVIIIAKKDHIHLININNSDYKLDYFNNTFLIFRYFNIVNDNKNR